MGPGPTGLVSLQEEETPELFPYLHRGKAMAGHSEEVAVTKPGKKGLTRAQACQHLDLGLLDSRTMKKQVLFKLTQSVVLS